MAQRVSLIPVAQSGVGLVVELVRCDPEQEAGVLERIGLYAERHQRARRISEEMCRGLRSCAFRDAGREDEYDRYVYVRPYLVTAPEPADGARIAGRLLACATDEEIRQILREQVSILGDLWHTPDPEEDEVGREPRDPWESVPGSLRQIKHVRWCHESGTPLNVKTAKELESEVPGLRMWSLDQCEITRLSPEQVPAHYGDSLGTLLGYIAGQCGPSWFMGRNYWLGILGYARLGFFAGRRFRRLQEGIRALGASPAPRFQAVALPGFEKGFSVDCPTCGSGMYIPPENVPRLYHLLLESWDDWTALGTRITGYPPQWLAGMQRTVLEALLWAQSAGCGLLEGDDLVY